MRIAYLVNQYPEVSHSFIRREIRALERQGFQVMRIALRGWDDELVDREDLLERESTRFVLRGGAPAIAASPDAHAAHEAGMPHAGTDACMAHGPSGGTTAVRAPHLSG